MNTSQVPTVFTSVVSAFREGAETRALGAGVTTRRWGKSVQFLDVAGTLGAVEAFLAVEHEDSPLSE